MDLQVIVWLFYYLLLPTLLLTGMRKFGVPARGELGVAWPCSWSCGSAYPQAPANFIKRLQTRRSVGDDVPTQPRPTIRRSVPGFSADGCCPLTNIVFSATSCQCEGYWEQANSWIHLGDNVPNRMSLLQTCIVHFSSVEGSETLQRAS